MKELTNLRKEREKHYLNEDGTITAYVYNEDVHYLDNGEYKEIDNTFIEENEYITNKSNNFKIKFNKNKYLVNIDLDNKNYLNISLKSNFATLAKLLNNEIIYEDILPNIDFHYLINGKSLKENIYLKDKINTNIIFNIGTNLDLVLKDNKVLAMNKEEVVYTFMPLFMTDVNNNLNDNCKYKLNRLEDHYELELILDQEYLDNAIYPVIVDPTINTEEIENVFDATLISDQKDHPSTKESKHIRVGSTPTRISRGLLRFILPNIKTGDNIINACIYLKPQSFNMFKELKPIAVHGVSSKWEEYKSTWNNMSENYNQNIETYFYPTTDIHTDETYYSIADITNLVKSWYTGKENNGVMLKLVDESCYDDGIEYGFYGKSADLVVDDPNTPPEDRAAKRPMLLVQYREQNGLLNHMSYEAATISKGAVYVNNCTGNLTTQITLSEILESNNLISLSLTSNTHDVLNNTNNGVGLGFNISYNELIIETINKLAKKEYKYIESNGATHYFYKSEDEVFIDEDGLSLTLEVINEENKEYKLTDKTGNKYLFTNSYLSKIECLDSEYVTILRDSQNKIIKISDSKNNEINITYDTNIITISGKRKNIVINLNDNKISTIVTKDGTLTFNYNENKLISKIIDLTGMSVGIDYYSESPYKVQKITQYGINNTVGKHKTFEYGFYTTTVTDNQNQKYRYSFNRLGNTTSTMLISKDGSLKNMYGFSENYINELGTPNTNKLQSETLPLLYAENLLNNSSFESSDSTLFNNCRTTEEARTGLYSAKIVTETTSNININLTEDKTYTFSAYFKNLDSVSLKLEFNGTEGSLDSFATDEYIITPNEEFSRHEINFFTTSACKSLSVTIKPLGNSPVYIDDMQLEIGDVANTYNMLYNGDFANDISGWNIYGNDEITGELIMPPYEVVTLDTGEKALKLGSSITGSGILTKRIFTSGKKGDVYTLSFIYKNTGILANSDMEGNFANILFGYPEDDTADYNHEAYNIFLNYHSNGWQMFTGTYVAEADYDSIDINVLSVHELNSIYITNISLVKDLGEYNYKYDEEGNLISTYDVINNKNEFKYDKNNELTSMFDAKGNNFSYEYDNKITDRVLKGISPTGISNEMKYDEHGNVIKTIINNVNPKGNKLEGNYYIRSKGTDKYITPNLKTGEITLKNDTCSHYSFKIDEHIETEVIGGYPVNTTVYKFLSSILQNYTLTKLAETISLIKNSDGTNFELIKKNNGSYNIKLYNGELKKDESDNDELYLKVLEDKISLMPLEDDPAFEFYFEDTDTNEFIETSANYTEDGKYITEVTDALGNKTSYNIDTAKGLTNSIINPKGVETQYTYDERERVKSIEVDNKKVEYAYENNSIKSIKTGNKEYEFEYDEFFNTSKVKINNNTLVTNEYEASNGQLKSITYGNGNKVSYEYDNFNRLLRSRKDTVYQNYYNNLGLLTKVSRGDFNLEQYYYDFAKRLSTYVYLDKFKINYKYDENSNINHKNYTLFEDTYKLDYEFNEDDSVIKVKFDENSLNFDYDYLGRLKSRDINGNIPEYFTYKKNGNKTSLIVDTMKIGENIYKYLYDELYNITEILKNDETINKYTYDTRSQLLSDSNYELNRKYIYTYDNEGNILTKEEYNLESNTLINKDNFKYENTSWEDQLTEFNNETITYDAIGNPITIGNKILSWQNGRELSSFKDGDIEINYTYNQNGIRTVKTYNDDSYINYYLEGYKIIFEERCKFVDGEKVTNMLYYIYDDSANVLGFKYNNQIYYYQKNYQNDITGIYDSNYRLVVTYKYDAWGKVLSVTDNTANKIGTTNPFRYRSYYYDEETKLYYLNSRYYNPEWCRFINADGIIGANQDILSLNLYAYVSNIPSSITDSNGCWGAAVFVTFLVAIVGTGVALILPNSIGMMVKAAANPVPKVYNNSSRLAETAKKSKHMQDIIKSKLKEHTKQPNKTSRYINSSNFYGENLNIADFDLKYSVGAFDYDIKITTTSESYIVDVKMFDVFDFTEWKKSLKLSSVLNNLGFVLQNINVVEPYPWVLEYQIEIAKDDIIE